MRWWYEIVEEVESGDELSERKIGEGEFTARDRKTAENKVSRMCVGEQMFNVWKVPLGDD